MEEKKSGNAYQNISKKRLKMNLFSDMNSERCKYVFNSFDLYQTIDVDKGK